MSATAAVSDVRRNEFPSRGIIKSPIDRETTIKNTKAKEKERELYFGMVKELQITLLITCMENATITRIKNISNRFSASLGVPHPVVDHALNEFVLSVFIALIFCRLFLLRSPRACPA